MRKNQFLSLAVLTLTLSAAFALPALAADASWVKPLDEGVKSLTSSVVSIAGGVIGIFIVGYAIWGAVQQQLDGRKFVTLFICGLLVGIGPALMIWWIDTVKQAG